MKRRILNAENTLSALLPYDLSILFFNHPPNRPLWVMRLHPVPCYSFINSPRSRKSEVFPITSNESHKRRTSTHGHENWNQSSTDNGYAGALYDRRRDL